MFRTSTLKLLVGLSLCTLGGAMLYVYFKTKEDEDEIDAMGGNQTVSSIAAGSSQNKHSKPVSVQITVSNDIVPVILGRSGANIKMIEDKTKTTIRFREKDDNNQYCEINGLQENVNKAKEMLTKEIQRSPNIREEIFVTQSACNKIIGRCGESLQEICRKSLAKVAVDSTISNNDTGDRNNSNNLTRRVVITGNRKQVNIAKKLIEEKIKENELFRKTLEESESKREPRRSPTNSISSNNSSLTTSSLTNFLPQKEKLTMINNGEALEKPMEVYVSAVASPTKFWLQIVGPQSKKLDELVQTMTDYYNDPENQNLHKIADPYLGQIVAALFKYDGKWYRAEIVGILPNEYNPRNVVLDLYFVDYGDSEYVAPNEVYELRTDFLTLRFQAVECYLAHVKPALPNESDIWDSQSIAKFEELTHVASWKKLISRVVSYKERSKGGKQSRREGSPVPGVELYDSSEGAEYNIAEVLISQGYAIPDYTTNTESSLQDPIASTSNDISRLDSSDPVSLDIAPPMTSSKTSDPSPSSSSSSTFTSSSSKVSSSMNGNGDLTNYSYNNGKHSQDESPHTTTEQCKVKSNTEQLIQNEKFNGNTVREKKKFKNHNLKKNLRQQS